MMSRLFRIAAVNIPYHVTQRGNARQFILTNDDERTVYWNLLRRYVELYELSLLGYCLMSNHVRPFTEKYGNVPSVPEFLSPSFQALMLPIKS